MKIVSWNVNSIKARLGHVKRYLEENAPDVLMVQELKGLEFPASEFEGLGYRTEAVCQKAYNGVALFSKTDIDIVLTALPGDESDEQARYIEADINGHRLIDIYLPNGNPVFDSESSPPPSGDLSRHQQIPGQAGDDINFSEKYEYKRSWMKRLYDRLKMLRDEGTEFIIGGDFNIIPQDEDCYDPKAWEGDALFLPQSRAQFRALENLGLYEAFRILNKEAGHYTFWDYQAGAWQKGHGIRIDHFLLSPYYADRLEGCVINRTPRSWEKPSDHTPIELVINDN